MSIWRWWKMSKRELTDTEKKICEKMIVKFEKEMQHLKFLERYYDIMVSEGCYWNYQERLKENRDKKREVLEDIQESIFKVVELKRELLEGVEEKKIPTAIG